MIESVNHQPSVVASEIPIVVLQVSVIIRHFKNLLEPRQIVYVGVLSH